MTEPPPSAAPAIATSHASTADDHHRKPGDPGSRSALGRTPISYECIEGAFVVDPGKFDFYAMDCYRMLADDQMAEHLANEVIQASTDFDGQERAPMRLAEARVTLGVVAARGGDVNSAVEQGERALSGERKSLPTLLMTSRELSRALSERYPSASSTREYLDHLRVLSQS